MGYGHLSCDRVDDLLLSMEVYSWDNHQWAMASIAMLNNQRVIESWIIYDLYMVKIPQESLIYRSNAPLGCLNIIQGRFQCAMFAK